MAVPKRKVSQARRDKRRGSNWKLVAPALVKCSQCGAFKLPTGPASPAVITEAVRSSRSTRTE